MTGGSRPRSFEDIFSRLPCAKQSGDSWTAPCLLPGHKTPAGHLTLKDAGDKALITCQGGRHTYQDYCQAWGFASLTYSGNGIGGSIANGKACQPVNGSQKQAQNRADTPLSTVVNGVNRLLSRDVAKRSRKQWQARRTATSANHPCRSRHNQAGSASLGTLGVEGMYGA